MKAKRAVKAVKHQVGNIYATSRAPAAVYASSPPAPFFLTLVTPAFSPARARADMDDLPLPGWPPPSPRPPPLLTAKAGGNGADNTLELESITQRE